MYRFMIFLFLLIFSLSALAQSDVNNWPTPAIAIIDYNAIERGSLAWQSFSEQLQKIKDSYQADIKKQQDTLKKWQEDLQKQSTILSPESFAKEEKKFRTEVQKLQQQTEQHKGELDTLFNQARLKFRISIASVIAEIAEKYNINLVIDKSKRNSSLFFWADNLVITEEVLELFNEKVPVVSVSIPKENKSKATQ